MLTLFMCVGKNLEQLLPDCDWLAFMADLFPSLSEEPVSAKCFREVEHEDTHIVNFRIIW